MAAQWARCEDAAIASTPPPTDHGEYERCSDLLAPTQRFSAV
jgi:hypothetical protein